MTEQDESDAKSGAQVQSLVRGLTVIRVFDAEHARLTLSEVARRAGLTRAIARRVLHTLVDLAYVATDGKNFSLRPKILELGYAYLSSMSLPTLVAPHLAALPQPLKSPHPLPYSTAKTSSTSHESPSGGSCLSISVWELDCRPMRRRWVAFCSRVLSASALRGDAEEIVENFLPKLLSAAKDIESDLVFVNR